MNLRLKQAWAHRKIYKINLDWRNLPLEDRERIYGVEQHAYCQLYSDRWRVLKRMPLVDARKSRTLMEVFTAAFMRYISKVKYQKPWALLRQSIESLIRTYDAKMFDYAFFIKFYRDNPDDFAVYFPQFCAHFNVDVKILPVDKSIPKKREMINKVGANKYAGANI